MAVTISCYSASASRLINKSYIYNSLKDLVQKQGIILKSSKVKHETMNELGDDIGLNLDKLIPTSINEKSSDLLETSSSPQANGA